MRFLLADDHTLVREGLRHFLERKYVNASVVETGSLEETLAALKKHPVMDLVLLDLLMPGMNGNPSIMKVCAAAIDAPVVLLSGSNLSKKDLEKTIQNGTRGFFPKSMEGNSLVSAINLVLSGGTYIPPQILSAPDVSDSASMTSQSPLSKREAEVLNLLSEGLSNKEIAQNLGVAEPTIKMHVKNLYRKIGVSSRTQAVAHYFGTA